MKLRGFNITRAQHGWVCDVCFTVTTARQFTSEEHVVRSGGRWLFTAMWNGYWLARREHNQLAATPEERRAKGWV